MSPGTHPWRGDDRRFAELTDLAGRRGLRYHAHVDSLRIVGGKRRSETVPVSGAKNAALSLLCASLASGASEAAIGADIACVEDEAQP